MKKYIITLFITIASLTNTQAQTEDPVHWSYGLKKIASDAYEIHILATIDNGWHIYAQKQLLSAVAIPTKIEFAKTEGLILVGKPIERGRKDTYNVKEAHITNYEYANKVDFVQKVSIKRGVKEIKGTITYQACTHEHCLIAQTISFKVPVN